MPLRLTPATRPAGLPNTCEYTAKTDRGDYLIQVAWPLCWGEDRIPPQNEVASTVYLVDGNAYFYTAVDITRRLEFTNETRTVVVGIGYPPSKYVYDFRRGPDLTPAPKDGKYEMPLDEEGKPRTDLKFGEANQFLDFIQHQVMPHIQKDFFPRASLESGRRALFGHSYGGIFALNALYTRPNLFDTFIAASPIVWWNASSLIKEQEVAFVESDERLDQPPSLAITWGSGQQDLQREPDESEQAFQKRRDCAENVQMRDSATALAARLEVCPKIRRVWKREFEGEDHGSAAVVGLQQGLQRFLVEGF